MNRYDEFVFLDDVRYTRRDWRNRNRIKMPQGPKWLTIPVETRGKYSQLIRETRITDSDWADNQWRQMRQCYGQSLFFETLRKEIEDCYRHAVERDLLSGVNVLFINAIRDLIGISAVVTCSTNYPSDSSKGDKILDICVQAGATNYLSGPAAKDYLVTSDFMSAVIHVEWMDYSGYAECPRRFEGFEHAVSILDLLFNTDPDAAKYWRTGS